MTAESHAEPADHEADPTPPAESAAEDSHVADATPPADETSPAEAHGESESSAGDDAVPHDDGAAELAAAAQPAIPDTKHWYIVKVQSGREESIKGAIERRVKIEGLEEYFGGIKIPMERVSEMRNGKRVVRSRKKFPGYLMVNVEFNDRILYLFRETSGVGDFVGGSIQRAPTPMPQHEVDRMLAEEAAAEGKQVPREKIKLKFDKGDRVKVRDGTFQGMEGEVKEIVEPKEAKDAVKVRVELTIFGRPVPVEVEAWQVDPV
jgi:transcription termination/antitermination protein NusG